MRYALRNKHKIAEAFGAEFLKGVILSLDQAFTCNTYKIDSKEGKYRILIIDNIENGNDSISFYAVGGKYDVLQLAFRDTSN